MAAPPHRNVDDWSVPLVVHGIRKPGRSVKCNSARTGPTSQLILFEWEENAGSRDIPVILATGID